MKDRLDNQIEGQLSITDILEPPERLIAVSRVFARARKDMSLAEQKTFVYALSELKFKDIPDKPIVYLDKKTLAQVLGIHSDPDHLSVDIYQSIKELPKHSFIEIDDKDKDLYDSGTVITRVTSLKNRLRIKFEEEYLELFTGLSTNYITMWSSDIFSMTSKRSVQFYEFLRQVSDTRKDINDVGLGIHALKDMFDIPKDGKGSYMREKGGFNRSEFEKKVIDPICSELLKTRMITLIIQPNGKPYEKIKRGNRVDGYRFYWAMTERPGIISASEAKELKENLHNDPQIVKIAEDIVKGRKKKISSKNVSKGFERDINLDDMEDILLDN